MRWRGGSASVRLQFRRALAPPGGLPACARGGDRRWLRRVRLCPGGARRVKPGRVGRRRHRPGPGRPLSDRRAGAAPAAARRQPGGQVRWRRGTHGRSRNPLRGAGARLEAGLRAVSGRARPGPEVHRRRRAHAGAAGLQHGAAGDHLGGTGARVPKRAAERSALLRAPSRHPLPVARSGRSLRRGHRTRLLGAHRPDRRPAGQGQHPGRARHAPGRMGVCVSVPRSA